MHSEQDRCSARGFEHRGGRRESRILELALPAASPSACALADAKRPDTTRPFGRACSPPDRPAKGFDVTEAHDLATQPTGGRVKRDRSTGAVAASGVRDDDRELAGR